SGLRVEGQADASGSVWFVRDGHGSDRLVTDDPLGRVVERYDYAAYGETVSFVRIDPDTQATTNITAAQAKTVQLFGGDGEYDPSSSFYYHDKRWRQTHRFVSMDDPNAGDPAEPSSLHAYLYTPGNPIGFDDATGCSWIGQLMVTTAMQGGLFAVRMAPGAVMVTKAITVACGVTFVESLIALELMRKGILPADGAQYVATVAQFTGIGYIAGLITTDLLQCVAQFSPTQTQRLPQDKAVDGLKAPRALPTGRPVAQNAAINAEKDADAQRLLAQGALDVRVDQRQSAMVNNQVVQKGINRPDEQGIFMSRPPIIFEYDTNARALLEHRVRILANDPKATVVLKYFDKNGNYTIIP
ncbi:MAG: hypothetical protein NTU53_00005, partial [Planctomycetota bacterium]|nr:hypothetical protein [Planctomycetota bacterium]